MPTPSAVRHGTASRRRAAVACSVLAVDSQLLAVDSQLLAVDSQLLAVDSQLLAVVGHRQQGVPAQSAPARRVSARRAMSALGPVAQGVRSICSAAKGHGPHDPMASPSSGTRRAARDRVNTRLATRNANREPVPESCVFRGRGRAPVRTSEDARELRAQILAAAEAEVRVEHAIVHKSQIGTRQPFGRIVKVGAAPCQTTASVGLA